MSALPVAFAPCAGITGKQENKRNKIVEEQWIQGRNFSLPSTFNWNASKSFQSQKQCPPWLELYISVKGKLDKPFQNFIIPKGKYVSVIHTVRSANQGMNYASWGGVGHLTMSLVPTNCSSVFKAKLQNGPHTEKFRNQSLEGKGVRTCSHLDKKYMVIDTFWKDPSVKSVLRESQEGMSWDKHEVPTAKVLIS